MSDREDDPRAISTSVALPVARGLRAGEGRARTTTWRPEPGARPAHDLDHRPSRPEPRFVSEARVRSLFERFVRTVEVGSVGHLEAQRELRAVLACRITETELWALMDRLAQRLPTPSARERFLLDVADLRV